MHDNNDFIKGFLDGNPKVLRAIYTRSFPFVLKYIISHDGQKKDAEDIFQNALLIIYTKLKQEKINIQSFDNYLFTVCKNLWRRENAKKRVTTNDLLPLVSEELNLAAFYVEQSQWELYQEKLKSLSVQCQEILKMLFEKVPYAHIVKKYGYASQTVARQRVFKCKSRLIKLIQKDKRYQRLKE